MALFRWFRTKPPAGSGTGSPPLPAGLDEAIAAIAALRSELAIRDAAQQFPRQFGPEVIPELRGRFGIMIEPPPSFSARVPSACAWAACWQLALYEILYQYREHALPLLREMAGGHDGAAIVLLCRLAAQGVDREQIVADLRSQMPDLPHPVRCDIAWHLLWLARNDPALAAVVEDLRQAPAFEQAMNEARQFGDEWEGPPSGGPGPPADPLRGGVARRTLFVAITLTFGAGVGVAVADSAGVWGAVLVGALATVFAAAVVSLVEVAVLNRM